MKLLGLRLCEHDSNISYFDGNVVHYYKSERQFQEKHHAFKNLTEWKSIVKKLWNIDHTEIDEIAIVVDPWHYGIEDKSFFPETEFNHLETPTKTTRLHHHYAHALSAWMMGESSLQIVIDGFGDADIAYTVIKDNKILEVGSLKDYGSLGLEMSTVGYKFGMINTHGLDIAGKLMGLQSYGNIDYEFKQELKPYGIRNVKEIFDYSKWEEHKGDKVFADLTKLDWIKTVHEHVGEKLVEFFSEFAEEGDTVIYSGGVAQNVLWNTLLKNKFKNLIIPPHCADDGLSLGAIEYLRRKHNLQKLSIDNFPYVQSDKSPDTIPTEDVFKKTAKFLAEGKIVAWYQGNGEIGPRALGNRSILMDPRIPDGKNKINKVKNREQYRPFGATVISEHKDKYFKSLCDNPHMLYVSEVINDQYPAITHVDGTCRAQTVDNTSSIGKLLKEFYNLTGCGVLLNTSLNLAGKPIAGNIDDAMSLFMNSSIDVLVVGNVLYVKEYK